MISVASRRSGWIRSLRAGSGCFPINAHNAVAVPVGAITVVVLSAALAALPAKTQAVEDTRSVLSEVRATHVGGAGGLE